MKIIVIDAVSDLYGSSRICNFVCNMMKDAGYEVSPYVREEYRFPNDRYAEQLDYPLIILSSLKSNPLSFMKAFIRSTVSFWKTSAALFHKVDLVYCNTLGTLPVCFIARLRGKKVLLHIHESLVLNRWKKWLFGKLILLASSGAVFVSQATASAWGLDKHPRAYIVRNGINDPYSGIDKQFLLSANRPYDFAFVGRLTEKKGISLFIRALQLLNKDLASSGRRVKVVIAGGVVPGQESALQKEILESFSNIKVEYLGEIKDTANLFLNTKINCVPSTYADPYPTVVLESLCAGCSVIASDIGGAREALHNSASSLFRAGDETALKEAMLFQLNSWDDANAVEHNRKLFLKLHTSDSFRSRLMPIVEALCKQ